MRRCEHPTYVCSLMTLLDGVEYCDSGACVIPGASKKMTNGDKLRMMSDEELAKLISRASDIHRITCEDAEHGCAYSCKYGIFCENSADTKEERFLKWLQQEVRECDAEKEKVT